MDGICRGGHSEIRVKVASNCRIKNGAHVLFCFSVTGLPARQKMKSFRKIENVSQGKASFAVLFTVFEIELHSSRNPRLPSYYTNTYRNTLPLGF